MNETELSRVEELISEMRLIELRQMLSTWEAPDLVDLLLELDKHERALVYRLLPRQLAADVFSDMDPLRQNSLLQDLTDDETRLLLQNLKPDDRTTIFEELPGAATQKLLNLLDPESLREARQLLGYPPQSVGRLMTPDYLAVRSFWTINRALEHIRKKGKELETINVIYVVDAQWKLIDAVELQRFILAEPEDTVEQIMDRRFTSIPAYEDREEAVRVIQRHDLFSLPVVDSEGVLVGAVTIDDVLDVAQEEATEDFQKVAAIAPLGVSYRESTVGGLYRKRVGWLVTLVLVSLASSGVIAAYESTLESAITLAFFIPLLIASGGNTGAQSAALMIRALATGDISLTEWGWTVARELAVGLGLGVTMGAAAWVLGLFRGGWEIAVVVGLTMVSIVIVANIIGVTLPFVLTKLGLDPAVASGPLITTLADATGLLIYFTIATMVLNI